MFSSVLVGCLFPQDYAKIAGQIAMILGIEIKKAPAKS